MLADALSEALDQIGYYQREFPECYEELGDWIGSVKKSIRDLQLHLDGASPKHTPKFEKIDGDFGHYISRYGMGTIRCIVSRNVKKIREVCAKHSLFRFQVTVPVGLNFHVTTEGLAREAVEMAEILRQSADSEQQHADEQPQSSVSLPQSVPTTSPAVTNSNITEQVQTVENHSIPMSITASDISSNDSNGKSDPLIIDAVPDQLAPPAPLHNPDSDLPKRRLALGDNPADYNLVEYLPGGKFRVLVGASTGRKVRAARTKLEGTERRRNVRVWDKNGHVLMFQKLDDNIFLVPDCDIFEDQNRST